MATRLSFLLFAARCLPRNAILSFDWFFLRLCFRVNAVATAVLILGVVWLTPPVSSPAKESSLEMLEVGFERCHLLLNFILRSSNVFAVENTASAVAVTPQHKYSLSESLDELELSTGCRVDVAHDTLLTNN